MERNKDVKRPMRNIVYIGVTISIMIAFVLGFYGIEILLSGPSGLHYIRQTDSLAFTTYFREYSINLLGPGVLDLRNAPENGQCAGEFPIIYWLLGMMERLFGPSPLGLKWIGLALVLLGHVSFYQALTKLFRDRSLALGLIVLIFSSGVVAHYACNYLPDAAVYGLVLLGWARAIPWLHSGNVRSDLWTTALFVLAGLIKAPASMHLVVWLFLVYRSAAYNKPVTHLFERIPLRSIMLLGIVATWHLYARWYNAIHNSEYFLTWAEPIWNMSQDEIRVVAELVTGYWWTKYLHPSVWHVLGILAFVVLYRVGKLPLPMRWTLALLFLACTAFVILFFRKLADHDYYFLTVMPFVTWLFTTGILVLKEWTSSKWAIWSLRIAIWVLALSAGSLAHTEVGRRANMKPDRYSRTAIITHSLCARPLVTALPLNARIIVIGDSTTNGALLCVGRKGWTYPGFPNTAEASLDTAVHDGASHVLYLDTLVDPIQSLTLVDRDASWSLWEITR